MEGARYGGPVDARRAVHHLPQCAGRAVWAVPVTGDRKPRMLIDTPYIEDEVHVSPDGRWVAFNADEAGRWEVFVASFPGFTSKRQISGDGGVQPQWSGDGRELFYLTTDGSMMGIRVTAGAGVRRQSAVALVCRAHPSRTRICHNTRSPLTASGSSRSYKRRESAPR